MGGPKVPDCLPESPMVVTAAIHLKSYPIDNYGLAEMTIPPLPQKKRSHFEREWTKLTKPQRRLEILERDNFSCHRSPLREYGVRLAVRHVVPVIEGGKTAPDNLETLCLDCQ